jgi:hypothetical protein
MLVAALHLGGCSRLFQQAHHPAAKQHHAFQPIIIGSAIIISMIGDIYRIALPMTTIGRETEMKSWRYC